jgi:acyl-CoA thioesterase-1
MPRAFRTLLFIVSLLVPVAAAAAAAAERSILILGDSVSAAYGIAQSRGWVALLRERLKRERLDYSVVNASVSGDTSSGGLSRIGAALEKHKPAVLILELGGNDGLRGLPIAEMRKNLGMIVERAHKAGARVLVVGMRLPPNYGPDYTTAFEASFADLAKRHKTALVPFLLEGFAERPDLFQPDQIHPTAAAQPLMEERIWKALRPLLR